MEEQLRLKESEVLVTGLVGFNVVPAENSDSETMQDQWRKLPLQTPQKVTPAFQVGSTVDKGFCFQLR